MVDPPAGFRCWTADIDIEEQGADTRVVWRIRYLIGAGRLGRSADRVLIAPFLGAVLAVSLSRLRREVEREGRRTAT